MAELFYQTLGKLVTTMDHNNQPVAVGNTKVYVQDLMHVYIDLLQVLGRWNLVKFCLAYVTG